MTDDADHPEILDTHMLADGELSGEDAARARAHLATCAICQAELGDVVQLDLAVAEVTKKKSVNVNVNDSREAPVHRVAPITDIASRRRRNIVVVGAVFAAAAATVLFVASRRKSGEGSVVVDPPTTIALADKRTIEARVSWGPASKHRAYDPPRGDVVHEQIPLSTLASVEQKGDTHGVGTLAILAGDPTRASTFLGKAGDSADVLADRAALALSQGQSELALSLTEAALAKDPQNPVATWNRALALRDLGLARAAAAAFTELAARGEPGWSDEAKTRATQISTEIEARTALMGRVGAASRGLVTDPNALAIADAKALPGFSRLVTYDAIRAATTDAQLTAFAPLADALGGGAPDLIVRSRKHVALAGTYGEILAGKRLDPKERTAYLAKLRAAHADDLLIGSLLKLSPDGRRVGDDDLAELVKLAAASPDPWMNVLGFEQRAAVALAHGDLPTAEAALLGGRALCPKAPGFRCMKLGIALLEVYVNWQRVAEARDVFAQTWKLARAEGDLGGERLLLEQRANLALIADDVVGSELAMARATTQELRLRQADQCSVDVWGRYLVGSILINQLRLPAARAELDAAPKSCEQAPQPLEAAQHLFVRAHLVRDGGSDADLATLRTEIAALRDDPATPISIRAMLDHAEGRAVIDRDFAEGEKLLRRSIATAKTAPAADSEAKKASAYSTLVLALAKAKRADGLAAVEELATAQSVAVPATCALGLALDDQRRLAIARDKAGAIVTHYDETRTSTSIDPATLVPAEIVKALTGCPAVDVIAASPIHGTPRILPTTIAWRYRSAHPATQPPRGTSSVVVADVEPPTSLGLPRLATWSASGTTITGAGATPARVLAAIGESGDAIIHAHGIADGTADAAHLALSPDLDGRYALTASAVNDAKFAKSPLVILAACRASQSAPTFHETWSLPAAFVHAGANAVIASAKPIPDAGAAAFFDEVRGLVRSGTDAANAVQQVREKLITTSGNDWVLDVLVFE